VTGHEPFCEGGHTDAITCANATAWREHERANPWHCWGASRNGYHRFGTEQPGPDERCANEGCDRTWGELEVTLIGRDQQ
jgi:hypothetical protein